MQHLVVELARREKHAVVEELCAFLLVRRAVGLVHVEAVARTKLEMCYFVPLFPVFLIWKTKVDEFKNRGQELSSSPTPADAENLDRPSEKFPEKTELTREARRKKIPRIKFKIASVFFGQETKNVKIEISQLIISTENRSRYAS